MKLFESHTRTDQEGWHSYTDSENKVSLDKKE
jgi:hypothetical protein